MVDSSFLIDELLMLLKKIISVAEMKNNFVLLGNGKTIEKGISMLEKRLKKGARVYGLRNLERHLKETLAVAEAKNLICFKSAKTEDEYIIGIELLKEETK